MRHIYDARQYVACTMRLNRHSRPQRRLTAAALSSVEPAEVNAARLPRYTREPGPGGADFRRDCYALRTALNRKVATAPFDSSGAFGLVLHWPLCLPDLYLGPYPAK